MNDSPPESLSERFIAFDDRLAAKNVPPLTKWWRDGLTAFLDRYEKEGVRELHANVGRGGIKSTALYKLLTFFAVFGEFTIPPDERHYAVHLSATKNEAEKGLAIISGYLRKLGVNATRVGDVLDLDDLPIGIRVVSASVTAASGWRAVVVTIDERAKLQLGGSDDFDAEEVVTSAMAMTVTHPNAVIASAYSSWGTSGPCYAAITEGSTPERHVLGPAPTWVANDNITEEQTHKLCHNKKRWEREYACQWQSGVISAFDSSDVRAAFTAIPSPELVPCRRVMLVDPSGGGSDAYSYGTARWLLPPEGSSLSPKLTIDWLGGIEQAADKYTTPQITDFIIGKARARGCLTIFSDQYSKWDLASAFAPTGLGFVPINWTNALKEQAVEHVANWLRDRTLLFGEATPGTAYEKLRQELFEFREIINPSTGAVTWKGKKKDDLSMLVMLLAAADLDGKIPGSPLTAAVQRRGLLQRMATRVGLEMSTAGSGSIESLEKLGYRPGSPEMLTAMRKLATALRAGKDWDEAIEDACKPGYVHAAELRGFRPATINDPGQSPNVGLTDEEAAAWEWMLSHQNERDGDEVEVDQHGDFRVWANHEIFGA